MRFATTPALDAIEQRLGTDPLRTGGVLDLDEAIHLPVLDGNRPANLLRLGLLIDGLSRQLSDESVAIYGVVERGILSDTDLTSNERMVLRRWSDDGLIEIIPAGAGVAGRMCEISLALGQPVITGRVLPAFVGLRLVPTPTAGGLTLTPDGAPTSQVGHGGPAEQTGPATTGRLTNRRWSCPVPGCASFGPAVTGNQPPPQLGDGGAASCPRHGERLTDTGPAPHTVAMVLRVGGVARYRFGLFPDVPVAVGRSPDEQDGVMLGPYLDENSRRRVSRSHLRLELRSGIVTVTDVSSNGSVVRSRPSRSQPAQSIQMTRGVPLALGDWDTVEVVEGVELGRADRLVGDPPAGQPGSVLQDAPTVALRLPRL